MFVLNEPNKKTPISVIHNLHIAWLSCFVRIKPNVTSF